MQRIWWVLFVLPLGASCLVPLGYTSSKAQGMISDSPSAQYLQLSMAFLGRGLDLKETLANDPAALEQGLADLQSQFLADVQTATRGLGGGDDIPLGDDSVVLRGTLAGTALTEVLGASEGARSLGDAADNLEAEYRKVVNAQSGGRGLFLTDQAVWPENTINYRWLSPSNPSSAHRQALLNSMAAWTQASGGHVKFRELEVSPWNEFQLTIGVLGCVVFQDASLPATLAGQATLGFQAGTLLGYLKLQPDLAGIGLRRTSLHEMGHVLGLIHEHKRADRDVWIDAASAGYSLGEVDMGKVDEYSSRIRWTPVQMKIGAWSVGFYYPVWWKIRTAEQVGTFDLKSVMIYSGFEIRKTWVEPGTNDTFVAGQDTVPWNTDISIEDAQAVRALYP